MKKILISLIIGFIIGFIATLICISVYGGSIDGNKSYGILEWIYYLTQPLAVVASTLAVIVALFGKEIKSCFIKEHCCVEFINSGFYENLGKEMNSLNPIAQSYDCFISLTNDGDQLIEECELILKEVMYKAKNEDKYKRIFSAEHKSLYWLSPEIKQINLYVKEKRKIPLFKIYPEASCQTPDNDTKSPLRMQIMGCSISDKYSRKGVWKAKYEIRSNTRSLKTFEVITTWTGVWCNRITEMDNEVSAKLNII